MCMSLLKDRTGLAGEGRDNLYREAYLIQVETCHLEGDMFSLNDIHDQS